MAWMEYLLLVPVGLFAGFTGGLLGIGGSVVMIPAMVLIHGGERQHLYQSAAMLANFFVVAPAVVRHAQARATLRPITRWMVPGAIIGAVAGVLLSELPVFRGSGQGYLQIGFGGFLAYVLGYNIKRLATQTRFPKLSDEDAAGRSKAATFCFVGLPSGLLSGLLGIGGGLFAVPAQQVCLRIPIRNAIANSAVMILWASVVGAAFKTAHLSTHGHSWAQSLAFTAFLAPPAMLGAYYSAAKVHVWPVKLVRAAFSVLLAYVLIRMILTGWGQVSGGS